MNLFEVASGNIINKPKHFKADDYTKQSSLKPIRFIDILKVNGELPKINDKVVELIGFGNSTTLLSYIALNFIGDNNLNRNNLILELSKLIDSINQLNNPDLYEIIKVIKTAYEKNNNNIKDTFEEKFFDLVNFYKNSNTISLEA